jgi:hypothetical protein
MPSARIRGQGIARMESFNVRTTIGRDDWQALLRAVNVRVVEHTRRSGSWFLRALPFVAWTVSVAFIVVLLEVRPRQFMLESMALTLVYFLALIWLFAWRQRRVYLPEEDGAFLGTTEFAFDRDGFEVTRANTRGRNDWALLREVTHTPTHIFLWIDRISGYVLRVADLPPPLTVEEAVARIRALAAASIPAPAPIASDPAAPAAESTGAPLEATPASVSASVGATIPTLWQELSALMRVELRREVDSAHLFGRDLTIFLLAVFSIGLWIGTDRLQYGENAEFMWYGATELGTVIVTGLVLAWILSRLSRPRLPLRRTLLLVTACSPILVVGAWISTEATLAVIAAVAILWIADLVHTGMRAMTGSRQPRAVLTAVVCFTLVVVLASRFYFVPGFWYEPEPDDGASAMASAEREQLLFEQASRIDAEVAGMKVGEAQPASTWFVGFAGFGQQRVFAEEIGTAARVIGAKYANEGRQLLLVNDRRDEGKYPFATVAALRHGLLAVGKRMNRDDDVLFLSLSSHGSEDATISVSNEARMFWRDLSAADLRTMLDESGIRWRVIVVSACHAGSFIGALADERTIVLTAAARENTSFGCSDDRDLTYFGEAFYRDALPQAASLRAAFESARASIGERERSEGIEPSEPQAHFGAEMERKLAELEVEVVSGGESRDKKRMRTVPNS